MRAWRLSAIIMVAALVAGCDLGGTSDTEFNTNTTAPTAPAPKPARQPTALCGRARVRVTGHVDAPAATELSGMVLSRSRKDVLWTHNDSGDSPRLLAVSPFGKLIAEVSVTGAGATDWEDIAAAGNTLYLGDIGDNTGSRPQVTVYRVEEPAAGQTTTTSAQAIALRYPDHPHDAEALMVDPSSGALVIVTKNFGGTARVYVANHPVAGATATLRLAGRVNLGAGEAATGADVSANGRTVAVRTYTSVYLWRRRGTEPVVSTLKRKPCRVRADMLVEGQGEAIALTADGRALYTAPEGVHPAIRIYTPAR